MTLEPGSFTTDLCGYTQMGVWSTGTPAEAHTNAYFHPNDIWTDSLESHKLDNLRDHVIYYHHY